MPHSKNQTGPDATTNSGKPSLFKSPTSPPPCLIRGNEESIYFNSYSPFPLDNAILIGWAGEFEIPSSPLSKITKST